MDNRRDILKKVYLVYIAVALLGVAVVAKVFYIQFVEGDIWREKAKELSIRFEKIEAVRGNILASDGSLLAASIPVFDLRIDAGNTHYNDDFFSEHVDSLAWHLADLFRDKTRQEYKQMLVKTTTGTSCSNATSLM
jgi:cell division protein FtsI (penicillin-binding protein 3)